MEYLDFEIEVLAAEAGAYTVRVLRSPAGEATSAMRLPFTGLALQNKMQALQIALLRSGTTRRRMETAESQTVKSFGQELWGALFSGDILGRFEATRSEARRQDAGVRIKLRFETPELAALPWEYLFDAGHGDYVALSEHTPVVRYIPLPDAMEPLLVQPPLRVLGMVVSPSDLPELDVDRERQRLDLALADLTQRGLVELVWMPGGTTRDLQQILRKGPWHVFHFIGHGGFDEVRGEGVVLFLDDVGKAQRVSATNLGRLLGDHHPLRLAVLNACESARGDQLDVFSSTAATLVRRGTPAVVAMQYEITDDAAIEFSRSFYDAVGSGIPVDTALADARKGVALANDGTLEWGTPVLYMRAPDGVLFDIASPAPAILPPSAPPAAAPPAAAPPAPVSSPEPEPVLSEPTRLEPPPMVAFSPKPFVAPPVPESSPLPSQPGPSVAGWTPPAKGGASRRKIILGLVAAMVGVFVLFAVSRALTPRYVPPVYVPPVSAAPGAFVPPTGVQSPNPVLPNTANASYVSGIGASLNLSCNGDVGSVRCNGTTVTGIPLGLTWFAADAAYGREFTFQWDRYDPQVQVDVAYVIRAVMGEPLGTQVLAWISAMPAAFDESQYFGPFLVHVSYPGSNSNGQVTIAG